jgi:hypothetical protein
MPWRSASRKLEKSTRWRSLSLARISPDHSTELENDSRTAAVRRGRPSWRRSWCFPARGTVWRRASQSAPCASRRSGRGPVPRRWSPAHTAELTSRKVVPARRPSSTLPLSVSRQTSMKPGCGCKPRVTSAICRPPAPARRGPAAAHPPARRPATAQAAARAAHHCPPRRFGARRHPSAARGSGSPSGQPLLRSAWWSACLRRGLAVDADQDRRRPAPGRPARWRRT